MLVRNPFRELLNVLLDPVVLCVEDVYAVERGSDAVLVDVVVAVPPDVVPLVQHQHSKSNIFLQFQCLFTARIQLIQHRSRFRIRFEDRKRF